VGVAAGAELALPQAPVRHPLGNLLAREVTPGGRKAAGPYLSRESKPRTFREKGITVRSCE